MLLISYSIERPVELASAKLVPDIGVLLSEYPEALIVWMFQMLILGGTSA